MTSPGPIVRRAGRRTVEILLWCGAGLGVLSVVAALAAASLGIVPLVFTSGSMSPEMPTGSLGLARTVAASELRVGDVVSVTGADGIRVTHRIVATEQQPSEVVLTLKGDTNPSPDQESYRVKEADRVFFNAPYVGRMVSAFTSPWGMFLGGLAVAALLFWAFRRQPPAATGGGQSELEAPLATSGKHRADHAKTRTSATLVAAAIPVLLLVTANSGTSARFTDTGTVGTTGFATTRLLQPNEVTCTASANAVTVRTSPSDPRYTYWVRAYTAADGGTPVSTPRQMTTGATPAATFAIADFAPALATGVTYWLRVSSRIGGWESTEYRRQPFSRPDTTTLACGEAIVPPTITFTQPTNAFNGTRSALQTRLNTDCGGFGSPVACGTATDDGTVASVQYILQRSSIFGTGCWDGSSWGSGCGYRNASRIVGQDRWAVAGDFGDTYFSFFGSYTYTLTIKATDNQSRVSEKSISYRVSP